MRSRTLGFAQLLHELFGTPGSADATDGQLLERFVTWRDEAAFETLLRRHGPLVLRVCRRVLSDRDAADDAFQATFLVLARKAGAIGKRDSVGSWLYGTAYRVACKARTSAARRQRRENHAATLVRPEAPAADDDLKPLLDEELQRLSERDRAPLVLCYLEGKTYVQAARELGWSEGSMSRRLARARERLRQRLLRRGIALSTAALSAALAAPASAAVPLALLTATLTGATCFATGQGTAAAAEAVALARATLASASLRRGGA